MLLIISQQMEGCEQVNTHNNKLLYLDSKVINDFLKNWVERG